jgi:CheY-like chemotaxis protein
MANLLIVDDQAGLREGISVFFESQGHEIKMASGVREAVDCIQRQRPDLVISDLMMKDGSGLELRQQISNLKLSTHPYFILFTAYPSHETATEAYLHGVDLYLTKPFQLPALALAVNAGLRQQAALSREVPDTLRRAEAFYHDFFLTLNPVLPRLLMLLEGRYGALGSAQVASVSSVFETWRRLVWTMADFYHRLLQPDSEMMAPSPWRGPAALKRILLKLGAELEAGAFSFDITAEPGLPAALVHSETAEALLETVLLRLMAISGSGARFSLHWSRVQDQLCLQVSSDLANPRLSVELIRNVAILPPVLPLLEEAGVQVKVTDDLGPWTLSFHAAH